MTAANKIKIPISRPSLEKKDQVEINHCFNSSWISSKSPWVSKFEILFAKKVSKTKYAVSVNSGTAALFLALKALEIGPGDEVIIPSFTMIATVNAVTWAGAKPVLIDSASKDDWNINAETIEKKITGHTKAIIPVHIYGYICQMEKIKKIAKKHKLYIIEDAAEAMGSTYNKKMAGGLGDIGCFSLYANKIITTGNGGMITTNSKKIYDRLKRISFFDFNKKDHFNHQLVGYNLVLSGLQAALGVSQIGRFGNLISKRRKIFSLYAKNLGSESKAHFVYPKNDQQPNFWFPAMIFDDKKNRDKVVGVLEKEGIETRLFFRPINRQKAYRHIIKKGKFPLADYFYDHGLLLPSFYNLEERQVKKISFFIKKVLDRS